MRAWFTAAFDAPTRPQALGWPAIARGDSTLILAPTGSGKTLTAFLWCLDRLMFSPAPPKAKRCRVLYVSPLKALAVDVERNLRAPLAGIAQIAGRPATPYAAPVDRDPHRRHRRSPSARFQREPARHSDHDARIALPAPHLERARSAALGRHGDHRRDSRARADQARRAPRRCRSSGSKRSCTQPPQRIGLSATQRPLDEVARFLGGAHTAAGARPSTGSARGRGKPPTLSSSSGERAEMEVADEFSTERTVSYRDVTIVDAGKKKELKLTIEVPVEDMAKLTTRGRYSERTRQSAAALGDRGRQSGRRFIRGLLDLIRAHRSTLIFVNSRRLAERLAGALNELAGETLVRSHHGSIARAQRMEIEDLLKAGMLRALVATSSLELGIDMGAIDLVVQIEAPPSVASGLQRIGRGGHQANAISEGVIFPKFRGDLVASAAVATRDARRRGRSDPLSAQSARHRRAADRRDGVDGPVECRRTVRDDPPRGAVRRVEPHGVRGRARHAVGALSVR